MAKAPAYAILGRGRWARRMGAILTDEGRAVGFVEQTRQHPAECTEAYRARLVAAIKASKAQVAWLCLPPGEHIVPVLQASLDAGLHAVVEQPWLIERLETERVIERAQALGRAVGVHYEYCMLEELGKWKAELVGGEHLEFVGVFHHSRSGHLGLPAMDVLGTHLLSMREYAVPNASVGRINCGYELADERQAWLERAGQKVAMIDFTESREPLIQRYARLFEKAMEAGDFAFGLEFAVRVREEAARLKASAVEIRQPPIPK
jgi:hypothetical protein